MNEFKLNKLYKWQTAHEPLEQVTVLEQSALTPAASSFKQIPNQSLVVNNIAHNLYRLMGTVTCDGTSATYFIPLGFITCDDGVKPKIVSNSSSVNAEVPTFIWNLDYSTHTGYETSFANQGGLSPIKNTEIIITDYPNAPGGPVFTVITELGDLAPFKAIMNVDITIAIPESSRAEYEII